MNGMWHLYDDDDDDLCRIYNAITPSCTQQPAIMLTDGHPYDRSQLLFAANHGPVDRRGSAHFSSVSNGQLRGASFTVGLAAAGIRETNH